MSRLEMELTSTRRAYSHFSARVSISLLPPIAHKALHPKSPLGADRVRPLCPLPLYNIDHMFYNSRARSAGP